MELLRGNKMNLRKFAKAKPIVDKLTDLEIKRQELWNLISADKDLRPLGISYGGNASKIDVVINQKSINTNNILEHIIYDIDTEIISLQNQLEDI
jgi:hypothetical protein